MEIMDKFLVWMEEKFGRFLLPVEFDQQTPPNRGYRASVKTPRPLVAPPVSSC